MMGYGRIGYGVGHMVGGGLGFGGLIFSFFLLALVAVLVIWLVAGRKHGMHHMAMCNQPQATYPAGGAQDNALAIARERLAKGEIDTDQYNVIVSALRG
ncbi:MAG: hypothetical protein D9V44_00515 [Actinobacteria bacterium]|nr:MAG: hypothetical protein D9V44_00515 [Actinomycetota bacterium]